MKNISKKNALDFTKQIQNILQQYNAKPFEGFTFMNKYRVNTKAGILEVSLRTAEDLNQQEIYSLFTCFEEPERASKYCGCSINTGKHNFFNINKDICIDEFRSLLQYIAIN